jgi:hypothetical protein
MTMEPAARLPYQATKVAFYKLAAIDIHFRRASWL